MTDNKHPAKTAKHTVTFEQENWEKAQRLAEQNGVTVSYLLNELVRKVESFEISAQFCVSDKKSG